MIHSLFGHISQTGQKELSNKSLNYSAVILDEIALEGLDGITLQSLWVRLNACPYFTMVIDPDSQRFIWEIVKRLEDVAMYELPIERPPLVIFNRFECIDPELGNVIEPDVIPEDIYPHKLVDDQTNGIFGSCSSYNGRKEITHKARRTTMEEATQKWGGRLVLVASQAVRAAALMGEDVDPSLDLNAMHYSILERIGRSRYLGEVTQGKMSLQCTGEEPKSLFYYRKTLQLHKLVTKQVFNLKSNTQHTCSGSLLHLPRFYTEHRPKAFYLTEKVVEILKNRPNHIAEYDEIRSQLGLANALKKLFKTPDFQRFVKTDMKVPYRAIHPAATLQQWKQKGSDREKMIRVVQLINPHASVKDEWTKEEDAEEEEEGNGYLDESSRILDQPLMMQAFNAVDNAGPDGLAQMELAKLLGQTKLQARTLCRNLLRKGLVSTFMNDVGRQRVCRYCSKRFDQSGHLSQQFHKERDKMLSLVSNKKNATDGEATAITTETYEENTSRGQIEENYLLPGPSSLVFVKVEQPELLENECNDYGFGTEQSFNQDCATSTSFESNDYNLSVIETIARKEGVKRTARDRAASKGMPRKKKKKSKSQPDVVWRREPQTDENEGVTTEVLIAEDASLVGITTTNSSFTEDLKDMYKKQMKDPPSITTRVLKRANLIMEAVQQHKVIDDVTKLLKLIHEKEEKEGVNTKIDKKSLLRLLEKLGKDGHIKNIRVVLKSATKEKNLTFVCEPNITIENSMIQSALEQAKMKLNIADRLTQIVPDNTNTPDGRQDVNFDTDTVTQSINELHDLQGGATPKTSQGKALKRTSKFGRLYGYMPKFVRMKMMHQLLFYLVYDYSGNSDLNQTETINTFKNETTVTDELTQEMPQIYHPTINWKMFIPPLPKHAGWPDGWTIMCDILLRLPLSIFVSLINVNYEVVGLQEYLSHPIRKHYLLKHLPSNIRSLLTVARRYIFNCHETLCRLCYIGLVQFGPQRLKEKDQIFIFINKNASLLDTTPSPAGYHQIATDMEYNVQHYHFRTSQDVDHYWYEMWNICIKTNLGGRMCVSGKDILLEVLENKPAMMSAIHPRKPEDAPAKDCGDVPGDHSGAAGLDSALFPHLKRNWHWSNQRASVTAVSNHAGVVNDNVSQKVTHSLEKTPKRNVQQKKETVSPRELTAKKSEDLAASSTEVISISALPPRRSKRKNTVRTVPLRRASRKKPYYDVADMEALALMSKLRVDWTAPEDHILLLCKVAATYLSPNPRQQVIPMQAWRDLLHRNIDSSRNKTSRAVQRRILYMMKNASTAKSVSLCLEEIKQDPEISGQFSNIRERLKNDSENADDLEKKMTEKFVELVTILQGRYQNMRSNSVSFKRLLLPDTLDQFRQKFTISSPAQTMRIKGRFHSPMSIEEIHAAVLNAMIYSSLCCQNDKTSYAFQLFKVYEQYPDDLLRSTISKIRSDQMVSLRKSYSRTKIKAGNVLPVTNSPFQLSISYLHLLQNRYQYEIFHECFTMLQKLAWDMLLNTDVNGVELLASDGGSTATFIEFLIMDKISFQITVPDQLIILDPRISKKDETYARLVARYRDILRNCKVGREMASSEVCKKPFMDILQRDEVWETEVETDSESGPSSNKKTKKNDGSESPVLPLSSENLQSTPGTSKTSEIDGEASESEDEEIENQKALQHTQQHAVARAASRIALYMMRGDTEEPNVTKVQETQHAHDFFVVNSCKVVCRLKEVVGKDTSVETIIGIDPQGARVKCPVVRSLLPVTAKDIAQILDDIRKRSVFAGPGLAEESVLLELQNQGLDSRLLKNVLAFVLSKKEIGASYADLRGQFSCPILELKHTVQALSEAQLVLKAGVTTVHFVHYKRVRPWLIHSKKLVRLDREKLKPSDGKAVDLSPTVHGNHESCEDEVLDLGDEVENIDDPELDIVSDSSPEDESGESHQQGSSNSCQKVLELKTVRTKRGTSRMREVSSSVFKDIDSVPSEQLRVVMRPWIRVDGSINRRVLDRLLGSVLGHCLSSPGCLLEKIGERFSPALQPVHSRELCEVLQKLGCIQLKVLERSHPVSLFSKARSIKLSDANGTENESDILIEPSEDAIVRLGLFIGDKAYSKDFLS